MIEAVHEFLSRSSPTVLSGLIVFILTQTIFGVVWVTRQEGRITALEIGIKADQILLARIDDRTHDFNLTVTREGGIIRNNVEILRGDVTRIIEQQQRIIQALDATNNQVQELRARPR
jgi:hypothetical protein